MRDICFLGIKVQGMYCGKHVFKVEFFRPEKKQYSAPVTVDYFRFVKVIIILLKTSLNLQ